MGRLRFEASDIPRKCDCDTQCRSLSLGCRINAAGRSPCNQPGFMSCYLPDPRTFFVSLLHSMDYAAQLLSSYEKTLLKKAKHFIATHPKTVKGAFITLQALTIASAFFDDGASLGALPEEEWLEAAAEAVAAEAAETAAETAESTEAAEGAGS